MENCFFVNIQLKQTPGIYMVRGMASEEGVTAMMVDQCMCGLKAWNDNRKKADTPARDRTKFMTNSPCIAEELSNIYTGS